MASSTVTSLCLLALVVVVTIGAASAAKPLPGSCLMAASTLCANADTNAMRCLRKLAIRGDARVPSACSEALMAGVTMNPRLKNQGTRPKRMSRMLSEGGACNGGNSCPNMLGATSASIRDLQCNDVLNGCGGACPTFTVGSIILYETFFSLASNPNGYACSNVCCKDHSGAGVCCASARTSGGLSSGWCAAAGASSCNIGATA